MGGAAYKRRCHLARSFALEHLALPRGVTRMAESLVMSVARSLLTSCSAAEKEALEDEQPEWWTAELVGELWEQVKAEGKCSSVPSGSGGAGESEEQTKARPNLVARAAERWATNNKGKVRENAVALKERYPGKRMQTCTNMATWRLFKQLSKT